MRDLWKYLKLYFAKDLMLPSQSLETAASRFSVKIIWNTIYFRTISFYFSNITCIVVGRSSFYVYISSLINQIIRVKIIKREIDFILKKCLLGITEKGTKLIKIDCLAF